MKLKKRKLLTLAYPYDDKTKLLLNKFERARSMETSSLSMETSSNYALKISKL